MAYKLVALDVDGTLLNDDHEITEKTRNTVMEAAKQGVEIVLCTGRGPLNSIPFMKSMGLGGYVISHNGAATVEVETQKIVHQFGMDPLQLEPFMKYCREHGVHFDVNTAFEMYVDQVEELAGPVRFMYENYLMLPSNLPAWEELSGPVVKLTAFGESADMDRVYGDWSKWNLPLNMLRSGEFFIDLMHRDASKGNALKQLAANRGYQQEEVLAIGNYFNDITMLTFAGMGIAMDNSPVEVKAAANAVTTSNNEDGVHEALVKYCLS
ncbi:Cof-like hydrolase [Paenibacillus vortex V453]|jgi:Cof subfamily protein (haloacid dehalogenase superfamily)|uniref:Hydrolase n=2 Tax=Paenibacillus TaxID=44249 RepID=A0A163EW18_9BACL|nr:MULTISPECIES: Cof-type HAD-IIB family hydrolase [Paenibacillus]ANA78657.1 hydrolase [Paenibacillus glucanolyticus]AVV57430.1 Cof-type HAD-IIB family hydrolase [Paenibacillus glucanolyticus]AWP26586.1 hydrolase [Paenibacillus sp. Cedars]EFU39515.1 Cof-like hydrolase [Paenibacillus vortex V453]ETT35339.1 Cof-like hydrolase [Paenibacillus sp. FSL R5-808]